MIYQIWNDNKMPDLFSEIIPSILERKTDVLKSVEDEKSYVPFVVNRALSYHQDCVLLVNEINLTPGVDKKLQYHFLMNTVRSWKRPFRKWMKLEKSKTVDAIKQYYGYSNSKAREVLPLLSKDQIKEILLAVDM